MLDFFSDQDRADAQRLQSIREHTQTDIQTSPITRQTLHDIGTQTEARAGYLEDKSSQTSPQVVQSPAESFISASDNTDTEELTNYPVPVPPTQPPSRRSPT